VTFSWKNSLRIWNTQEFIGMWPLAAIIYGYNSYHFAASYLNNPEAMGGAAYFGLALISASKLVLCLAVVRHIANWWFLSNVEQ